MSKKNFNQRLNKSSSNIAQSLQLSEKELKQLQKTYQISYLLDKYLPFWLIKLLAHFFGFLLWFTGSKIYKVAYKNVDIAKEKLNLKTTAEVKRFVRRNMYYTALVSFSFFAQCSWSNKKFWDKLRFIHGPMPIADANNSIIQLTVHGSSTGYSRLHSMLSPNSKILVKYRADSALASAFHLLHYRDSDENSMGTSASKAGVKQFIHNMRKPVSSCTIAIDTNPKDSKLFAKFFGINTKTTHMVYTLKKYHNAKIYWFVTTINDDGTHNLHYIPASQELYSDDIGEHLENLNQQAEDIICNILREQYVFWSYKRHDTIKYY